MSNLETYSESRGFDSINWNERLNKKIISEAEWLEWESDAGNWVTCACGNQCSVIPREQDDHFEDFGQPLDYELNKLGRIFYSKVQDRNVSGAKKVLINIERRSCQLINEINKP